MRISIQTGDIVDRLGFEVGYKMIADCGFEAIDWNLDHALKSSDLRNGTYRGKSILEKPLDEVIAHYEKELDIIKKNNLVITQAHAPFPACILDKPETLDYMIEIFKRNIEYCDYAGCKHLVVHPMSLSPTNYENSYEEVQAINDKLYESLIPTLLKTDVIVCTENMFTGQSGFCFHGHSSDPREAAELIDKMNEKAGKEVFGFCLDTGHANLTRWDFRHIVSILNKRIKCLHIHDNNGINDSHLAPFSCGTVNWKGFCYALKSIGYDGDLSFETFNQTNIAMDFDASLLEPWMRLIFETGKVFKKHIANKE
jgi:sugar phosphate isomerase/epimerase